MIWIQIVQIWRHLKSTLLAQYCVDDSGKMVMDRRSIGNRFCFENEELLKPIGGYRCLNFIGWIDIGNGESVTFSQNGCWGIQ